MTDQHLILLDASGFGFRSYYAFPARYRSSDGLPTGATLGFISMLWRTLGAAQADKPTHGAAIFDAPGGNFRHKIYPAYKANRPAARREELDAQFPYMKHAAETLGIKPVECAGFEADDVIATLATQAVAAGMRVTIVSSDKDYGQLVEDGSTEIVDPMKKCRCLAEDVRKKFGVDPKYVPHVQALAGDAVDGIPGIKGCGLERAGALIRRYKSVSGVLKHIDDIEWPQVRVALRRNGDDAKTFLKLTTLRRDVRLGVKPEDLALEPVMKSHLVDLLKVLEASARIDEIFMLDRQLVRVVPHVESPYQWWEEELRASGQPIPDEPQCGFYRRRLVRGGPLVAAKIWRVPEVDPITSELTGNDLLRCEVDGKARDPNIEWSRLFSNPITRKDFGYEEADAAHAKAYRPNDPKSQPNKPINLLEHSAPRNPNFKPKRRSSK